MWKVDLIESERGWGQKVDEVKTFDTYEAAEKFRDEFNQKNKDDWERTREVPDWYMYATDPYKG